MWCCMCVLYLGQNLLHLFIVSLNVRTLEGLSLMVDLTYLYAVCILLWCHNFKIYHVEELLTCDSIKHVFSHDLYLCLPWTIALNIIFRKTCTLILCVCLFGFCRIRSFGIERGISYPLTVLLFDSTCTSKPCNTTSLFPNKIQQLELHWLQ